MAILPAPPICFARPSTSTLAIPADSAWLMKSERQAGASESYVTTVIPLLIADFRVGHSAEESDADTMSAFAPLVMADWIAGICDAAVAAEPLVSVPFSPSSFSAASAPPDLTLSATVKYGLPRFFGMTKTLSPFLRGAAEDDAIAVGTKASM